MACRRLECAMVYNGEVGKWWSIINDKQEVVTIPIVGTKQFAKIAERYYPGQNMKFEDIFKNAKTNEIAQKGGGSNKRRRGRILTKRRRRRVHRTKRRRR